MTDFFNDAWTSFLAYFGAEGGILATIFQIVVVLVLAWLIIRTVDKGTRRWVKQFEALPAIHPRRQRAFTTSSLLTSSVRYIVWPIALIMVLSELNIDVAAMIATAGIAGLAIGFGAQTFVKDVISGIFLLFDDTIHVGDMVKIGGEEGTVEFIGIRLIKVRKFNGEMLMVPAGELRIFGNLSIGYARVIVDVGLSYEQDLETILPVLEHIAHTWAEAHREILLEEEPQVQAITHFADSSINARIVVKVQPGDQFEAERALRRMLKQEFDRQGIEIPFPRRTVYMRQEQPARSLPDTNQ